MKLKEGWFNSNNQIPDKMIDSYLSDYLVYNYMRIYNIFPKELENNYKKLVNDLYTLNTFKDLDAKVNNFITNEALNQPKKNRINTFNRLIKDFGIPDSVIDSAVEDFRQNELNENNYNEATIEKNPYEPGSFKSIMWRPSQDNLEEDDEDWMMLWKNSTQVEATEKTYELNKKLSENCIHNSNESISEYLIRMKKLFTE